jgi:hypothetical protein
MIKTRRIILVALAAVMAVGICASTAASGGQPKLAQVVYITLSKACGCALTACQAGDIVVGNVFKGARKALLKRIDYSTNKESAKVYIKKYRLTQAPVLMFLDAKGNLLWTKAGDLDEKEIADKLSQFGG